MRFGWPAVLVMAVGCDGSGDLKVGRAADLDELMDRVEALEAQVVPTVVVADVPCDLGAATVPVSLPHPESTFVSATIRAAGTEGRGVVDSRDIVIFGDRVEVDCDAGLLITVTAMGPGVALP